MHRARVHESLERIWVSWLDSNGFRQFVKQGLGSRVVRSAAYGRMDTARRYLTSYWVSRREPALLANLETFCLFVGHTKSGGSLIGAMLDAHPDAILADEEDVLHYVANGFTLPQMGHLLIKGSRRESLKGHITARRLEPYSLHVPGQWQGRFRTLRVIGASKAGPTTRRLSQHPELLERLRRTVTQGEVKLIQVIRNPFDPISLMTLRSGRSLPNAIDHYFGYCRTLASIRNQVEASRFLAVRYEALIGDPRPTLTRICNFVGLSTPAAYLDACLSTLSSEPHRSREGVQWDAAAIDRVQRQIDQFDFLEGYTFTS